jgi:hypothetical protein
MSKRILFIASFLCLGVGLAGADSHSEKKKDDKKDDKVVIKCQITKAGDKDVSPAVDVDYMAAYKAKAPITPVVAKALCKSQANKPAQGVVKDNGACAGKKMTHKYTVQFGPEGKEEKFEQNVICPKEPKAKK